MLFHSIDFAIFLPVVFCLYWFVTARSLRLQNLLIVAASYIFYGWWDWRFLSLLIFSTVVDFVVGRLLSHQNIHYKRKLLLSVSIVCNLGLLGFFKYYNFFADNFVHAFRFFGQEISTGTLNIILPVGISFYTFQTLSYAIDVYRRKLEASTDVLSFAAFVSFFPQLVAGPIERATHLLPQFQRHRHFNYDQAADGMRQMLWGFFKKIAIADNCATLANLFFNDSQDHSGSELLLGTLFFTFQIYCDFSGYSDIAIGCAKLFGVELMQNFAYPYFSTSIPEFWKRWHISLSTWFRDYLYFPLGGNRISKIITVRNMFIVFIVSGFWHGANWTFIAWGLLNAFYMLPHVLRKSGNNGINTQEVKIPSTKTVFSILVTFTLTAFAWIFFRAESLSHAFGIISEIFSSSLFTVPSFEGRRLAVTTSILITLLMCIEWRGKDRSYAIAGIGATSRPFRHAIYYSLMLIILMFGGNEQEFIYFQF
jgi:alginate O-acetyltransferase complex protein AlgI